MQIHTKHKTEWALGAAQQHTQIKCLTYMQIHSRHTTTDMHTKHKLTYTQNTKQSELSALRNKHTQIEYLIYMQIHIKHETEWALGTAQQHTAASGRDLGFNPRRKQLHHSLTSLYTSQPRRNTQYQTSRTPAKTRSSPANARSRRFTDICTVRQRLCTIQQHTNIQSERVHTPRKQPSRGTHIDATRTHVVTRACHAASYIHPE